MLSPWNCFCLFRQFLPIWWRNDSGFIRYIHFLRDINNLVNGFDISSWIPNVVSWSEVSAFFWELPVQFLSFVFYLLNGHAIGILKEKNMFIFVALATKNKEKNCSVWHVLTARPLPRQCKRIWNLFDPN